MKKLFYTLTLLLLGLSAANAQEYAVGNTYKGVIADKFIHSALNSNEYPYILNYSITYLENKNLKIDFEFTWENDIPEGNVNWLNIWIDGVLVGANVESTFGPTNTPSIHIFNQVTLPSGISFSQVKSKSIFKFLFSR